MPQTPLTSTTLLKTKIFKVKKESYKKSDGATTKDYFTIERADSTLIIAFTTKMEIILIHQYRHAVRSTDYELPAGYIESTDKNPKLSAMRELMEETGYKTDKLEKISQSYASSGLMTNSIHFFIGFNAKKIQNQKLDDNEEIAVKVLPWAKALKLAKQGKIKDLASLTGIYLAKEYLINNNVKI